MQDNIDDKEADYCSIEHQYWIDILNNLEVKDDNRRDNAMIKQNKASTDKKGGYEDSNRNENVNIPCNKRKARTGQNLSMEAAAKIWGVHHYCIIYKNSVIHNIKFDSHYSNNWFILKYKVDSTKKDLRGVFRKLYDAVEQFFKS